VCTSDPPRKTSGSDARSGRCQIEPKFENATMQEAENDHVRCTLLAGSFDYLVQLSLALAAVGTLLYKRRIEKHKRPWVVWAFDSSKQAYAGVLQHLVNMALGLAFASNDGAGASECAWYLVNFTITTVLGIALLVGIMRVWRYAVEEMGWTLLRSGHYGDPPSWRPWLAQMLVWGFVASGEKVVTAFLVIIPLHDQLDAVAEWIEAPLRQYPNTELLLVMVLAPMLLNALYFWVIDNLIKLGGGQQGSALGRGGSSPSLH
jgi:hypothetical protein